MMDYIDYIVRNIAYRMISDRRLFFTYDDITEAMKIGVEATEDIVSGVLRAFEEKLVSHGMKLYRIDNEFMNRYCIFPSELPSGVQCIICSYANRYRDLHADIIMEFVNRNMEEYGDPMAWSLYTIAKIFNVPYDRREEKRGRYVSGIPVFAEVYVYGSTEIVVLHTFIDEKIYREYSLDRKLFEELT